MLASILTFSALLASFCILSTPAPADLALLQNARTPVGGESGFATLTATLEATASLPSEIPRMERDEAEPLAVARKNLSLWQTLPAAERAALQPDLPLLLRFTHFRRAASIENLPKFSRLFALREINAFRFVSGKQEAALQSACDTAVIGRRLLLSDNAAFAVLRDPAHLPEGIRSDGAFLYIDLLPTQQGVQTLTLPLPGTQVR